MLHIPYTICRSGTYYYNRHVPKHAVEAYGAFIRQALSKCPEEAMARKNSKEELLVMRRVLSTGLGIIWGLDFNHHRAGGVSDGFQSGHESIRF